MPSTFFGLNIANSALNAFQTAVNTTANNISNVKTQGYTKQVANRQASDSLRVYQSYGTIGTGVTTTSITSLRDSYYDQKYWQNQSSFGFYTTKLSYMNQIESYYTDDDNQEGFSTIFSKMFNNLDSLTKSASDTTVRSAFISSAQTFASYFKQVSNSLSSLQKDSNDEIKTQVDNINSISQKITALNKQINSIEGQGGTANELRDQRALLVDELSSIVPVTVTETPLSNSNYPDMVVGGTNFVVKANGQNLVDTYNYNALSCVARDYKVNQTDNEGLYDIKWAASGTDFSLSSDNMTGTLKALFDTRDGNNSENFQGKVVAATSNSLTISPSTMKTVESMSMASEGYLNINGSKYYYSGFTANADDSGNITSYTFNLNAGTLDNASIAKASGSTAQIGTANANRGVPYYMSQMNEFLRSFTSRFNAYQQSGEDLKGKKMGSFFVADKVDGSEFDFSDQTVSTDGVTKGSASTITSTSDSYYQLTALNFAVADASIKDSSIFSTTTSVANGTDAYDLVTKMKNLQSNVDMFRGGSADDFLQCLLSDISVDTQSAEIFSTNYTSIQTSITNQRLSVAGVDQDEEALDLVKFQNAYNLAAKMIQTMSEMYDRLITQTGV